LFPSQVSLNHPNGRSSISQSLSDNIVFIGSDNNSSVLGESTNEVLIRLVWRSLLAGAWSESLGRGGHIGLMAEKPPLFFNNKVITITFKKVKIRRRDE
jgi:hypothetical protein